MSLSEKTEEQLSSLLSDYGIRHGPIVDSTRKLYERKLEEAMKERQEQPSSDKTYYREEEEEVTYITYHSPVKHEAYTNVLKQRNHSEPDQDQDQDQDKDRHADRDAEEDIEPHLVPQTTKAVNQQAAPPTGSRKGVSCVWTLLKLLLLLAMFAAALYFSLCRLAEPPGQPSEAAASEL